MNGSEVARIAVRATIHLPGLAAGEEALVDPTSPYIAEALEHGYLLSVDPPPEQE